MVPQISASTGPPLLWHVEGKPVTVYLEAEVRADLRARALASNGAETGGLLLGRAEASGPGFVTRIYGFEPFETDEQYGPAYVLSPADRERLKARTARVSRGGTQAVGFWRTHLRRDLYLDKRDLSTFQLCFPHPASVVLLVKAEVGTARGGIFIWEDGDIRRHTSYAEFPLEDTAPAKPHTASRRLKMAAAVLLAAALPIGAYYAGRAAARNTPAAAPVAIPQPLVSIELIPPADLPLGAGDLFVPPAAVQKRLPRIPAGTPLQHHPAVTLSVRVDEQGRAADVRCREGDPGLADAAMAAVRQWTFSPARLNHVPVACEVLVRLIFRDSQR